MCRFRKALLLGKAMMLRPPRRALVLLQERNSVQQNENGLLDTRRSSSFNSRSSGALIALIGQEGESGAQRRFNGDASPELPPQLSAVSPSLTCHWTLPCEVWEGGEG